MDTKDLIEQLIQKGIHLGSINRFLKNAIQLKDEMSSFARDSEEKLNTALEKHANSAVVTQLRERFKNDYAMLINCTLHIVEYQADIIATKNEIKGLERLIGASLNKKAHSDFFRKKKDDLDKDGRQNSSIVFYDPPAERKSMC
jgi:ABC-type transporter Mla subunit MlaD